MSDIEILGKLQAVGERLDILLEMISKMADHLIDTGELLTHTGEIVIRMEKRIEALEQKYKEITC